MNKAYLEILFTAIIWGTSGIFIKTLHLPNTTVSFFRLFIPTLIFGIYLYLKRIKFFRTDTKLLVGISAINALKIFFYVIAFYYTSVGNAVAVFYTWPIFVAILAALILKEKIEKKTIFLIAMAFFGVIVIQLGNPFSFASKDFIGMMASLVAAFTTGLVMVIGKSLTLKINQYENVFYQSFLGAIIFMPFIFINVPLPTLDQFAYGSVFGLFIGAVSYALFFSAMSKIKASHASFLAYLDIVFAFILAWIILKEPITLNMIAGGSLIIGSAILLTRFQSKAKN